MQDYQVENRHYLQSHLFLKHQLPHHGFTSRSGGVSHGTVSGLNLGFRVGDDANDVRENYRLVAKDLSLNYDRMVLSKQTHTDNLRLVTELDAGKGLTQPSDIEDTDGLITNCTGIPLVVFSADCVPLLFFDPMKKVIAAVHAGWRGTVKGIAGKTIITMQAHYGCNPKDILVAIGPSIGPCCLTFSQEDTGVFDSSYLTPAENDKALVDLWAINRDQLITQGVLPEHIDNSRVCTVCHADRYYSYRTHKERTGRQGAVIML